MVRALDVLGAAAQTMSVADLWPRIEATIGDLRGFDEVDRAMLVYTARLTLAPRAMKAEDLGAMRAAGLSDAEILDVNQVICCFSYMNRLADGTGVTLSAERADWAVQLYGQDALEAHFAWGEEVGN